MYQAVSRCPENSPMKSKHLQSNSFGQLASQTIDRPQANRPVCVLRCLHFILSRLRYIQLPEGGFSYMDIADAGKGECSDLGRGAPQQHQNWQKKQTTKAVETEISQHIVKISFHQRDSKAITGCRRLHLIQRNFRDLQATWRRRGIYFTIVL